MRASIAILVVTAGIAGATWIHGRSHTVVYRTAAVGTLAPAATLIARVRNSWDDEAAIGAVGASLALAAGVLTVGRKKSPPDP